MNLDIPNTTQILLKCRLCGKEKTVEVDKDDLLDYYKGKHIQYAFPYLSVEDRELMISQTCDECWNKFIVEEE